MNDTTASDTQVDINTSAEDVDNDVDTGSDDEGSSQEPAPKPFRAWELPEPEAPPEPSQIPYSRFREVNDERKALQTQLAEYEAKLADLQARQEKLDQIKDPDDINIEDYDDPKEYLKARDAAIKAAAVKEVEERWIARETEKARREHLQNIHANFTRNVEEAVKRNPEIRNAVDFMDKHGERLHPAVAHELLTDPNVGELSLAITTNPNLLRAVFSANPQDVVRAIQRLSGRIDAMKMHEARSAEPSAPDSDARKDAAAVLQAAIPTALRPAPAAARKDPSKMTSAEYRRYVDSQKKKR